MPIQPESRRAYSSRSAQSLILATSGTDAAQRRDLTLGALQVVLGERAADGELDERHPVGHQIAYRRIALLLAQLARIAPARLDGHERLRHEMLVERERLARGGLAGRVTVEGEDDLASGARPGRAAAGAAA